MKKKCFLLGVVIGIFCTLLILVCYPKQALITFYDTVATWFVSVIENVSSGEVLTFFGSIISAVATVFLGWAALEQNKRIEQNNNGKQTELLLINNRVQKNEIMEIFLRYVDAARNMFFVLEFYPDKKLKKQDRDILMLALLQKEKDFDAEQRRMLCYKQYANDSYIEYVEKIKNDIQGLTNEKCTVPTIRRKLVKFWKENYDEFTQKSCTFIEDVDELLTETLLKPYEED